MNELRRRDIAMLVDQEQAGMELIAVARPERLDDLLTEVERREAMMAEWWRTHPDGHGCTVHAAALRSVAADVIRGYL